MSYKMDLETLYQKIVATQMSSLAWCSGFWLIEFCENNPGLSFRIMQEPVLGPSGEILKKVVDLFIVDNLTGEIHSLEWLRKRPEQCRVFLGLPELVKGGAAI